MTSASVPRSVERLLIVCPTWLGDAVMATPTLRALRGLYPQARITALVRPNVRQVLVGLPWVDRFVTVRGRRKGRHDARRNGPFQLARRLGTGRFDAAVLLSNSFRTALLVRMAGIPRRIGYDRDGRGGLLTDRLLPRKAMGKFVPVPARDYYLGIARYLGADEPDPTLALYTRAEDDARATDLLASMGRAPGQPVVILNPGASFGPSKLWPAERFAAVGRECKRDFGAMVLVSGAPRERSIVAQVMAASGGQFTDLTAAGLSLGMLKSVIRQANLLVTNDTGPRHIAAALGVPVVTIFGPTDAAWTQIGFEQERQVMADVYCRPCQKKKCPLRGTRDFHICMKRIEPETVFTRAAELLKPAGLATDERR